MWNDDENLYVAIDFTGDNTIDGDKDYAKVYVNTGNEVREFKVSVPEQKWGVAGFTYTKNVHYQHKVYEFKIPLSEIVSGDIKKQDALLLAFSAYGTNGGACCFVDGSCSSYPDRLVCEEGNGGIYQGDGTSCQPNPCQQPASIPTMTQWGIIIFVVSLGLGAGYYMRRQIRKNS